MKKEKGLKKDEMRTGAKDATVYTAAGREVLEEDDELDTWEEGFMEGAEDDGEQGKCANCGAALLDYKTVETKIDGKTYWFCSNKCVKHYKENRMGEEQI